jgi:pilus assembly protein CpaB
MSRHFGATPVRGEGKGIILAVSVVFLLIFVLVAYVFLRPQKTTSASSGEIPIVSGPEPEIREVEVLIPKKTISPGSKLKPSMFRKEKRPKFGLEEKRIVSDFEQVVGYYARSLIISGQPLHMDYISNVKPTTAISADIPAGFRAVSIKVTATSSVEGWARPGSKVDVIWASRIRGEPGVTVIVQNAKVLSAERQVSSDTQPGMPIPTTVTLLVTAEDAQKIQLASTTGSLSLNLRGDSDVGKTDITGSITVQDLLEGTRRGDQKKRRANQGVVTMGGKKYIVDIDGKLQPLDLDS